MTLPNGDRAIIPKGKLEGYVLNDSHLAGMHKARVFRAALGITADNAKILSAELLKAAAYSEAKFAENNGYGDIFVIRFIMTGPNGKEAVVHSAWFTSSEEVAIPSLASCRITT